MVAVAGVCVMMVVDRLPLGLPQLQWGYLLLLLLSLPLKKK